MRAARQNFPWHKKLKLMQTEHLRNLDKNSCLQRYSILVLEWTIYHVELETSFFQQFLGRFYAMDGRKPENFSSAQN